MLYERGYRERKDLKAIRLDQPLKATSPPTTEAMVVSLCAAMLSSLLRENVLSLAARVSCFRYAPFENSSNKGTPPQGERGQIPFLTKGYSLFHLQCAPVG